MRFAEFRVYVQVEETRDMTLASVREFIRACIGTLDGVNAVEVELPRGSTWKTDDREVVRMRTGSAI
jgi:hypothetical protein